MIEQTAHIEMDAVPGHVYAVAAALDWFGPDIRVTRLSGSGGLSGRYGVATRALGTDFAFTVEVDAADEPHRLAFAPPAQRSAASRACTPSSRADADRTSRSASGPGRMDASG
jgi:hypothetical protein